MSKTDAATAAGATVQRRGWRRQSPSLVSQAKHKEWTVQLGRSYFTADSVSVSEGGGAAPSMKPCVRETSVAQSTFLRSPI
jgi:hypothetical protein